MDSFEEFLRKVVEGEADATLVDIVEKALELRQSLASFIPKHLDESTSWDMAVIEYAAWLNLEPYIVPTTDAWVKFVLYVKSAVFSAYWLGRRDQNLEGMLGGVEMNNE